MGVTPYNIWFPLFALFGVAIVVPVWQGWVFPEVRAYPLHIQLLMTSIPVFLVTLIGISWLEPR